MRSRKIYGKAARHLISRVLIGAGIALAAVAQAEAHTCTISPEAAKSGAMTGTALILSAAKSSGSGDEHYPVIAKLYRRQKNIPAGTYDDTVVVTLRVDSAQ